MKERKQMISITSLGNSLYSLYLKNTEQNSNNQSLNGVSNNNSALTSLDSTNFSQEGLNLLNSSTQSSTNPLDSLVSSGTLTQTQANTVNSAFQAAIQLNSSGTYGSTPFNPITSLVNNGTITQAQATAITNAYVSAYKSTDDTLTSSTTSTVDSMLDGSASTTNSSLTGNTDEAILDELSNNGITNEENYMDSACDPLLGASDSSDTIF
jgi:polyhydroxyalkanoate synthesis regulator phasin